MDDVKVTDIDPLNQLPKGRFISGKEFREAGFLQEANRLFFHPFGLALAMMEPDPGEGCFLTVVDRRELPGGVIFAPELDLAEKQKKLVIEKAERFAARLKAYGYWIQRASDTEYTREDAIRDRDESFRNLMEVMTLIKETLTLKNVNPDALKDKIVTDDRYESAAKLTSSKI